MKFEPQCKTKADLYRQWARVLEMIECTEFKQESFWKFLGNRKLVSPDFSGSPSSYEFAIAIVEGRPVFRGDELYCNDTKVIADGVAAAFGCEMRVKFPEGMILSVNTARFSWNPPKPKTISLIDMPIPNHVDFWQTIDPIELGKSLTMKIDFATPEAAEQFKCKFSKCLMESKK